MLIGIIEGKVKLKVRKKYIISFGIFGLAIYFQFAGIEIQDNFVELVKWTTLGLLGGFSVKTVAEKFLSRS